MVDDASARQALAAWSFVPSHARLSRITTGLINQTYRVEAGDDGVFALQKLSPIFGREVHLDIDAVTRHLEDKGLITPRLVPTDHGSLDVSVAYSSSEDGPGSREGVWRLMTWVDGVNRTQLDGPEPARASGRLLGRFHAALADFRAPFAHTRLGVHDTPKHLAGLAQALDEGRTHPAHADIAPLGEAILRAAAQLPPLPEVSDRVVHGDPKISNLVFAPDGTGRALIDLDTLARMPLPLELGDAFRSWCNPSGEDANNARFDLELFEAAVQGYAEGSSGSVAPEERDALVSATRTIMVELAARFCRDALEDRYFGWDPVRFPSRSVHNRVRAAGQLALSADLQSRSAEAERCVKLAFRS